MQPADHLADYRRPATDDFFHYRRPTTDYLPDAVVLARHEVGCDLNEQPRRE